ncbi:MAG: hypothetical protein WC663_01005 [Patescibacteria group bacterium]|jgi:hypothetical protein
MANEMQTPQEVIDAAESEIPTQQEAVEAQGESKTYGAVDLDAKLITYQDKNAQEYTKEEGYRSEDVSNYSEGDMIGALQDGRKMSKDDTRSALASLDSSGIKRLQEMAADSRVRNRERNKNVEQEYTNAGRLEKLAQQAEQLTSLRSEEGQRKFIQEIAQSLNFGTYLNRKTTNKLNSTLSLLQTHDPEAKKIIFNEIKPALQDAVKDSNLPSDKDTVDKIIAEYQG